MNHLTKCFCVYFLLLSPMVFAEDCKTHEVSVEIKISCPMSDELEEFAKSIPDHSSVQSVSFEEWKVSFVNSMTKLISLVESEKVGNSLWSASVNYAAED